jgi:hypothetical protein
MVQTQFDLLYTLAGADSDDDRNAILFRNPTLLTSGVQQALADALLSAEGDRVGSALAYLREKRKALDAGTTPYPIGPGPIERLWTRLDDGEISAEEAESLAREEGVKAPLPLPYVRRLSVLALNRAAEGNSQQALDLGRLLLAATEQMTSSDEAWATGSLAVLYWLMLASYALSDVPDGRVYRSASKAGERLLQQAEARQDIRTQGEVLHALGVLNLDPQVAGRDSVNFPRQTRLWLERLYEVLGDQVVLLGEDVFRMPIGVDALRLAERYFRRAAELRSGGEKGLSLKALANTLEWLQVLNAQINQDEVIGLCREALRLLDRDESIGKIINLLAMLDRAGDPSLDVIRELLNTSLDEYLRRSPPDSVVYFVLTAANVLTEHEPQRAIGLLQNARPLFARFGQENERITSWQLELQAIARAAATSSLPEVPQQGGFTRAADELRAKADGERWDISALAGSLLWLAMHSPNENEEPAGLAMLNEFKRLAPILADGHTDALTLLEATLLLGAGVNAFHENDWEGANRAYSMALTFFLDLGQLQASMDCLRRIGDMVQRQGPTEACSAVFVLAPSALQLESRAGEPASRLIQDLCRRAVSTLHEGRSVKVEPLFQAIRVAKGMRFATALVTGSHYRWQEDQRGLELLRTIKEAEATLSSTVAVQSAAKGSVGLDENLLLTAYIRRDEQRPGKTPDERLANLRHRYDAHLMENLLAGARGRGEFYFTTDQMRAALDERTVLLDYYLGPTADGQTAVYMLLVTREEVAASVVIHPFPSGSVVFDDDEYTTMMNLFGITVHTRREEIEAEPGPRPVSYEGGQGLAYDTRAYLGHFVEQLELMRARGKDHLCVVPHGPLHFYPFHLLGEPGRPLADRWVVTYLPSLHLLVSRQGMPVVHHPRDRILTALGVSFPKGNPKALPELFPAKETRAVADVFGASPILDDLATPRVFLEALQRSRYVHLSTHGLHKVDAPSFQALALAADGDSDGWLYAYELLGLDLRGLEVLTLSACETALGRFDTSDNLRGLPAALLLAGVRTLVGTLWPVTPEAAEQFSTLFYRKLKAGASRLDAFGTAQRETRKSFPQYRDWGTFYMIGDWS